MIYEGYDDDEMRRRWGSQATKARISEFVSQGGTSSDLRVRVKPGKEAEKLIGRTS